MIKDRYVSKQAPEKVKAAPTSKKAKATESKEQLKTPPKGPRKKRKNSSTTSEREFSSPKDRMMRGYKNRAI